MDKDLYSKAGQLIVYVADELADENFQKEKETGGHSNNLEITGNFG